VILGRFAPCPSAEVARGSEDAFARGLQPRELPPGHPPQRWTGPHPVFRFRHLPAGPRSLEIALHAQRAPVLVAIGGVVRATLNPGQTAVQIPLAEGGRAVDVELQVTTFRAPDGRTLGALLDRVALRHERPSWPSPGIVVGLVLPALVLSVGAVLATACPPTLAVILAALVTVVQTFLLWPQGVVRSPYQAMLAFELAAAAAVVIAFAAWSERRVLGAAPWALVAGVAAVLVQGAVATAPEMVVSDAVFHANKLTEVAAGNLFPVSRTQHSPPFVIPYGVSFYALLAPFYRWIASPVDLVRAGAAVSGLVASAALFLLLVASGPARAGLAVMLLQLLPGTFIIHSYGNLSNVFAQSVTVLFFCWWAGETRGGWPVGAALLAIAGLAHLSGFIVLGVLCVTLAIVRGRPFWRDPVRLRAASVGLGLTAAYYLAFWPLIHQALLRLREGGGQGHGPSRGVLGGVARQGRVALEQWGIPAILLAALGCRNLRRRGLDQDLVAYWAAGALLFVPAVLSPLDVRYLYALTLPVAVAAASGLLGLLRGGTPGRALAAILLAWQGLLAGGGIVEAVLHRYR
jgi:hypothetical protein